MVFVNGIDSDRCCGCYWKCVMRYLCCMVMQCNCQVQNRTMGGKRSGRQLIVGVSGHCEIVVGVSKRKTQSELHVQRGDRLYKRSTVLKAWFYYNIIYKHKYRCVCLSIYNKNANMCARSFLIKKIYFYMKFYFLENLYH